MRCWPTDLNNGPTTQVHKKEKPGRAIPRHPHQCPSQIRQPLIAGKAIHRTRGQARFHRRSSYARGGPPVSFFFFLWKPNWQLSFPDATPLMVSAYRFRFVLWAHSILSSSFNLIFWYYTVQLIHSQRTYKFTPLWTHVRKLYTYANSTPMSI